MILEDRVGKFLVFIVSVGFFLGIGLVLGIFVCFISIWWFFLF